MRRGQDLFRWVKCRIAFPDNFIVSPISFHSQKRPLTESSIPGRLVAPRIEQGSNLNGVKKEPPPAFGKERHFV